MRASAIRFLSTCRFANLLAAGLWKKAIQIWNLEKKEEVAHIETSMVDGSNELHLDPGGTLGVVAGWRSGKNGGVACYEVPSGKIAWHRTDLRHAQGLSYSTDGLSIWFEPNEGRVQRLDLLTGKTIETLTGVKHFRTSDYSAATLVERRSGDYILRGKKDFAIPKMTFAILDVAFGSESLCITESTGPVRCIDCGSGSEVWRYKPEADNHVLRLWYREADKNYYGVQWNYQAGRPRTLLQFYGPSGQATQICQLDSWEEAVCPGLDCIVLSSGQMLSLQGGKSLGRLDFPQQDYPDKKL